MGLFHCQKTCQRGQRNTHGIISAEPWMGKKRIKWKVQSLHNFRYETTKCDVECARDYGPCFMGQVVKKYYFVEIYKSGGKARWKAISMQRVTRMWNNGEGWR